MKRFLLTLVDLLTDLKKEQEMKSPKSLVLGHYLNVTKDCVKQTKKGILFKKLTANYRDTLNDEFYEKLQRTLQKKMNAEIIIWKKIKELEDRAFEIIESNSINDKDALIRCILLQTNKMSKKEKTIKDSIDYEEKIIQESWKHYYKCVGEKDITSLCLTHLKNNDSDQIIDDLKKLPETTFYEELEPLIIKTCNNKKPQQIELIAKKILYNSAKKFFNPYKIHAFLNLNKAWVREFLHLKPKLQAHIVTCLDDEDFLRASRDLNQIIEDYVSENI